MTNRDNAEPSQCIRIFMTNYKQYSLWFSAFSLNHSREILNIQIDYHYLREDTKEECQKMTTKNKVDRPRLFFKETVKVKDKQKIQ